MPNQKTKILIIEDDKKVVALYDKFLSRDAFEVEFVDESSFAMEAYERAQPDILLVDVLLPSPSRLDLIKKVRDSFEEANTTIIIASTQPEEQLKPEYAPYDVQGYLPKPFALHTLNHFILSLHPHHRPNLDIDYDAKFPKLRVLIAEDDKKVAILYTKYLPQQQFQLEVVKDGKRALQTYAQWKPHVVLLDLFMPNMNGADVLKEIRENKSDFYTTIIIASSEGSEKVVRKCAKYDIQGYLVKPFDLRKLANTLITHRQAHLRDLQAIGWNGSDT